MDTSRLTVDSPMGAIMDTLPGARRALFSRYHLGGCESCGFSPTETLAELARRAAEAAPEEMLEHILEAHEHDQAMFIEPEMAKGELDSSHPPLLLDTRTREEHEAVAIPGSVFMDQDCQQKLFGGPPDRKILLYDHTGKHVLNTCSWFHGHGMKNTKAIEGGIDKWSQQVDSSIKRYRLEVE